MKNKINVLNSFRDFLHTKNAGFTLIELLVVISIIGLLASVVLVSLNSARQKSRDAKRVSDMNQMAKALEMYFDNNKSYPSYASWTSLNGVVGLTPTVILSIPKTPSPVDNPPGSNVCSSAGGCGANNNYCYQGSTNFYTLTFCLGAAVGGTAGGLQPGVRTLTPGGFR